MTRNQRQRVNALANGGGLYPANWPEIAAFVKEAAGNSCVRCRHVHDRAQGFVLTVHHLTMQKDNCQPWNLMAACQRCHLRIQGKVDFLQPYMGEHSQWMQPFVDMYDGLKRERFAPVPLSEPWKLLVRSIATVAIWHRPVCTCPGWIYQHPDGARSPECEAHGLMDFAARAAERGGK